MDLRDATVSRNPGVLMKFAARLFAATSVAAVSVLGLSTTANAQSSTTVASTTLASTTSTTIRPVQILPITCENALTHGAWVSAQPKGKRRNDAAKSDCGKRKESTTKAAPETPANGNGNGNSGNAKGNSVNAKGKKK